MDTLVNDSSFLWLLLWENNANIELKMSNLSSEGTKNGVHYKLHL